MVWYVCLALTVIAFAAVAAGGITLRKKENLNPEVLSTVNILLAGSAISLLIWNFPFAGEQGCVWYEYPTFIVCRVLQTFSLDFVYTDSIEEFASCPAQLAPVYRLVGSLLGFLCPVMLAGAVLSVLRGLTGDMKLRSALKGDVQIFSALNESSLQLAQTAPGGKNIFANVPNDSEELNALREQAKQMGALCTERAPQDPLFAQSIAEHKRRFFLMSGDEPENVRLALALSETYRTEKNAEIYVFAAGSVSTLLLGPATDDSEAAVKEHGEVNMRLRRIDPVQSLVFRYFYENTLYGGVALPPEGAEEIAVPIAVAGFGHYGEEFVKAAVWAGQLPGIRPEIHIFDIDPKAESRFAADCPELLAMNHSTVEGEAHYDIIFHGEGKGADATTGELDAVLLSKPFRAGFAALKTDDDSIAVAVRMRVLFNQYAAKTGSAAPQPLVDAVVKSAEKARSVNEGRLRDYKGNDYNIRAIGSAADTCSWDTVVNSELEQLGLKRHLAWSSADTMASDTRAFFRHEYNYSSSIASEIRKKIRREAGVSGIDLPKSERTDAQHRLLQMTEHRGWNAFMRCFGYSYGKKRDDYAKLHWYLVPFDALEPKVQRLDEDD